MQHGGRQEEMHLCCNVRTATDHLLSPLNVRCLQKSSVTQEEEEEEAALSQPERSYKDGRVMKGFKKISNHETNKVSSN